MVEDFEKIDRLFAEAIELPESQRDRYVRDQAGADSALCAQVLRLLAVEATENFESANAIARRTWRELAGGATFVQPGDIVGRYRILEEIGRGGMAVVYRARRIDGEYDQEVALKVALPALVGREFEQRFTQERQILADLRHANIALLLDGGTSNSAGPYLVMELIDGEPIDLFCAKNDLNVRQRVELVLQVIDALGSAHRQLVVHRDLKPSNVLVTPQGTVKLLDFGIAKLLDPLAVLSDDDQSKPITLIQSRVLTPQFASPEQIRAQPVGTSTDVYQTGALLYLLLTGQPPCDLGSGTPAEVEHAICTVEPDLPSFAAGQEPDSAPASPRALRGDLDAILMTALQKEPLSRYSSIEALGAELRSWMGGFAVRARSASRAYLLRRWVGRHRVLAATAAATLFYASTMTWLGSRWSQQRDDAHSAGRRAESVTLFLEDLFAEADPRVAGEGGLSALELMQRAPKLLDVTTLGATPVEAREQEARIRLTIARVLSRFGDSAGTERQIEAVLNLTPEEPSSSSVQATLLRAADLTSRNRSEAALSLLGELEQQIVGLGQKIAQEDQLEPRRLWLTARSLNIDGRQSAAESAALQALEQLDGQHSVRAERLRLEILVTLADIARLQARHDEAVELQQQVFRRFEELYGAEHPALIRPLGPLAAALGSRGVALQVTDPKAAAQTFQEVEQLLDRGLQIAQDHWGEHPLVSADLLDLRGMLGLARNNWENAAAALTRARDIYATFDGRGMSQATSQLLLGVCQMELGQFRAAQASFRGSLAVFVEMGGPQHVKVSSAHYQLGRLGMREHRWNDAIDHLETAIEIRAAKDGQAGSVATYELELADALAQSVLLGELAAPLTERRAQQAIRIYERYAERLSKVQRARREQLSTSL